MYWWSCLQRVRHRAGVEGMCTVKPRGVNCILRGETELRQEGLWQSEVLRKQKRWEEKRPEEQREGMAVAGRGAGQTRGSWGRWVTEREAGCTPTSCEALVMPQMPWSLPSPSCLSWLSFAPRRPGFSLTTVLSAFPGYPHYFHEESPCPLTLSLLFSMGLWDIRFLCVNPTQPRYPPICASSMAALFPASCFTFLSVSRTPSTQCPAGTSSPMCPHQSSSLSTPQVEFSRLSYFFGWFPPYSWSQRL